MCTRETRPMLARELHRPPLSGSNPVPRCYYCKYTECVSFFRKRPELYVTRPRWKLQPLALRNRSLPPTTNSPLVLLRFKYLRINSRGWERARKRHVYDTPNIPGRRNDTYNFKRVLFYVATENDVTRSAWWERAILASQRVFLYFCLWQIEESVDEQPLEICPMN